jgi:hypothetical protein
MDTKIIRGRLRLEMVSDLELIAASAVIALFFVVINELK